MWRLRVEILYLFVLDILFICHFLSSAPALKRWTYTLKYKSHSETVFQHLEKRRQLRPRTYIQKCQVSKAFLDNLVERTTLSSTGKKIKNCIANRLEFEVGIQIYGNSRNSGVQMRWNPPPSPKPKKRWGRGFFLKSSHLEMVPGWVISSHSLILNCL